MKWTREEFWLTDDQSVVDMEFVGESLRTTYWAKVRPQDIVEESVRASVMLSLFDRDRPVGFTRIVSDFVTFAWICDVFVHADYRGRKLGEWMFVCALEHPAADVTQKLLATLDAHGLYEKFGFQRCECMRLLNLESKNESG